MSTVDLIEPDGQLARLLDRLSSGAEREIIVARNGQPTARLTAVDLPSEAPTSADEAPVDTSRRLGFFKHRLKLPHDYLTRDAEADADLAEGWFEAGVYSQDDLDQARAHAKWMRAEYEAGRGPDWEHPKQS